MNSVVQHLCVVIFCMQCYASVSLLYFYFCLPLMPLGASWGEKDVFLLHVGMPECIQHASVSNITESLLVDNIISVTIT